MFRMPTLYQFQSQANLITQQYQTLDSLEAQINSETKLVNLYDDPVLGSQVLAAQDFIDQLDSYSRNGTLAQARQTLFSTCAQSAVSTMSSAMLLMNTAQKGALQDSDRLNLATQLKGNLTTLLSLANKQDANGEYIYAGYNTGSPPYLQGNNSFQYQGTDNPSMIDIGQGVSVLYDDSGYNVFGNIYLGNGTFTVTANTGNTGVASTSPGSVVDSANYIADNYTVSFVQNSAGKLAYQVVGTNSGQVIPAPPLVAPDDAPEYVPGSAGQDVSFNGLTININGAAKLGDSFQIAPSTPQDVFDTIQSAINLLSNPITNQGVYNQQLSQLSAAFGQGFNQFVAYQSTVGTGANTITTEVSANELAKFNQKKTLGALNDADYVSVFSQIQQATLALQATQQGYMKIQDVFAQLLKM